MTAGPPDGQQFHEVAHGPGIYRETLGMELGQGAQFRAQQQSELAAHDDAALRGSVVSGARK